MLERVSADISGMSPLSPVDAVSLLFNTTDVDLELAGGGLLRVHKILVEGETVTVTAPRLSVATGMILTGRVIGPDRRPWELTLQVDDAAYHTPDLAMLRLHPTAVGVDDSRRVAERVPIGGVAWLEAVNCQDVVDRDRVDGTLEDLSRSGVAFTTARVLRVGDRLLFHGRFFADSIRGEVRVASVRPAAAPGQTIVGCRFIDIDELSVTKIDRILSGGRVSEPVDRVDLASLRDLAAGGEDDDDPSTGWLRRITRRDD